MTLFERVHMPSFAGATEWLNSEPLGSAELRGHVVLANFWTLTCINRLRQEPYVRAWSQAYRDDGAGMARPAHRGRLPVPVVVVT
jgi:thiol-disulfide isomerase/thioredoxin